MDTLAIDQSAPMPVVRPGTVAEVGDLVRQARGKHEGIYPAGGRTTLDVGLPPAKPGLVLDTTALSGVIDYPARDMTITVRAGITFAALEAELAKEGQWLPVAVPSPERATLGGAIALNKSGPRRYGYGTLRDYVIGISFVTDDGVEVKAGGRVVKNVAGYDLMKLQIGAVGTLGVVTQVTLKVRPKPEASAAVVLGCRPDQVGPVLDRLHASKSRPVAVELLNQAAWRAWGTSPLITGDWLIAVGFEEKAATVKWQLATLREELGGADPLDVVEVPGPSALWAALTQLQIRPESRLITRASVLPGRLAETVTKSSAGLVHAEALSGIIWQHDGDSAAPGAVIRRFPLDEKKGLSVWGQPSPAWDLMRTVKRTLDPDGVFNPGRLFGDL